MMNLKRVSLFLFSCILLINLSNKAHAQTFDNKVDSLIQTVFKDKNGPGGIFMVAKDGKPIYKKAFGKANLESDVNMTPENVVQIGSMTKQFTAIAILMLEEQGKLNVTNSISKYIPDYPSGMYLEMESVTFSFPCSSNIKMAIAVNCLVIEPI